MEDDRQPIDCSCRTCGGPTQVWGACYAGQTECDKCKEAQYAEIRKRQKVCKYCGGKAGRVHYKCDPCLQKHMEPWVRRAVAKRHEARLAAIGMDVRGPKTEQEARWAHLTHSIVSRAIRHGLLPKLDGTIACTDCGGAAKVYDHRDYSRPLDVEPVCTSCNCRRYMGKWPEPKTFPRVAAQQAAA